MPEKNNEKEVQVEQIKYASRLLRCAAALIDAIIVTFLGLIVLAPFYFLGTIDLESDSNTTMSLVSFVYSVILIKLKNATFGKQFFGLEVKTENGSKVSWLRAILRETVGKILSSLILMLGFVWILFDQKRQGWHDKLAKTVVIEAKEVSKGKRILAWILALGLPILALLGVLAVIVLVAINPVEQLAKTRDVGRMSSITQLGRSIEQYYQDKGSYPEQTNNWITDLVSSGVLDSVPNKIPNEKDKSSECASSAGNENGLCYENSFTNTIVYTLSESETEKKKCQINEKAWFVYRSELQKGETECLESRIYPKVTSVDSTLISPTLTVNNNLIITPTTKPSLTPTGSAQKGFRSYGKKTIDNDQKITLLNASINSGTVNASFSLENTKDSKVITSTRFTIKNKDYFISSNNNSMIEMPPNETKTITATFDVSSNELKDPPYTFLYENNNGAGHVLVNSIELGTFSP